MLDSGRVNGKYTRIGGDTKVAEFDTKVGDDCRSRWACRGRIRVTSGGGLLNADALIDFENPASFLVSLFEVVCSVLHIRVK